MVLILIGSTFRVFFIIRVTIRWVFSFDIVFFGILFVFILGWVYGEDLFFREYGEFIVIGLGK